MALKEWRAATQDKDLLLHGAKLLEAEEKLKLFQTDLNPREIDFIRASVQAKQLAEQQKDLAMEVISRFTYAIPEN